METKTIIAAVVFLALGGCANPPIVPGGGLGYQKEIKTQRSYPKGDTPGAPVEEERTEITNIDVDNPDNSEGVGLSIGSDGSVSSENAGSFMSEGDASAIFWGGLLFAIMGVGGIIARLVYQIKFPFAIGVMMIGIGSGAIFLNKIAGSAGVLGVLAYLAAVTLAAWWVSSTSMGRDAARALEDKIKLQEAE